MLKERTFACWSDRSAYFYRNFFFAEECITIKGWSWLFSVAAPLQLANEMADFSDKNVPHCQNKCLVLQTLRSWRTFSLTQSEFWCAVGWFKRVWTHGGDSWALESTAAVVGDEEKLSKGLFTGNCLFTVKGRLRWIESVTMKGSHTDTHLEENITHTET